MSERYVLRMRLNNGMAEEYKRRHDAIWPELGRLAARRWRQRLFDPSGRGDRPPHWRSDSNGKSPDGGLAGASCHAEMVGPYGGHHGNERG